MARTRFVLDTSTLNDENVGLDGFSPAFTLDTSTLDGAGKLDGYTFQTNATCSAALGAVSASAEADVIVNIQAIGVSELGGLTSNATTSVIAWVVVSTPCTQLSGTTISRNWYGAAAAKAWRTRTSLVGCP